MKTRGLKIPMNKNKQKNTKSKNQSNEEYNTQKNQKNP